MSAKKKKSKKEKQEGSVVTMLRNLFQDALTQKKKRKNQIYADEEQADIDARVEYSIAMCLRAMAVYDVKNEFHESLQYDNLFKKRPKSDLKRPKRKPRKLLEAPKEPKGITEVESFEEEPQPDQEKATEQEGEVKQEEKVKQEEAVKEEVKEEEKKPEEETLVEDKKEEDDEEEKVEEEKEEEKEIILKGESTFLIQKFGSKEKVIESFKQGKLSSTLFDILYERRAFFVPPIESTSSEEFWSSLRKRIILFYFYSRGDFTEDEFIPYIEYYGFEKTFKKHELSLTLQDFKTEFPDTINFSNEKALILDILKYKPSNDLKVSEDYHPIIAILIQWLSNRKGTIKLWEFDCLLASLSFKDLKDANDYSTFKETSGEKRNKFVNSSLIDISAQFHIGLSWVLILNDSLDRPFGTLNNVHYLFSSLRFQNYYSKALAAFKTTDYSIGKLIALLKLSDDAKVRMASMRNEILKNLK